MKYVIENDGELWGGAKGWMVPTSYADVIACHYDGVLPVVERIAQELSVKWSATVIELDDYLAGTDFLNFAPYDVGAWEENHQTFSQGFQRHEEPRRYV